MWWDFTDAFESFVVFPVGYMILNVLLAVVLSTTATTELSTAEANSLIDQGLRMSGFVSTAAISIVTLTFSLTVLSIQIAAQSYSPRLLDAFLKDPVTKLVISVNVGAYTFCYTLQCFANKSEDDSSGLVSVPAVAIHLQSVQFALVMVSFINFIHFFVNGFRVEKILARAAASSLRAAQALSSQYPPLKAGDSQWFQSLEQQDENNKAAAAPRFVFSEYFGCTLQLPPPFLAANLTL